jgi:hypothetical protein
MGQVADTKILIRNINGTHAMHAEATGFCSTSG